MRAIGKASRDTQLSIMVDANSLKIALSGHVGARSLDTILREMSRVSRDKSSVSNMENLIVDLSGVNTIAPAGATGLVSLCSALMTNRIAEMGNPSVIYLRHPPEHVLTYLTAIGFFTLMSAKAKLLGCGDFVRREDRLRERDRRTRIEGVLDKSSNSGNRPVVWPMRIIGHKEVGSGYRAFENACQSLVNDAINHFDELFSSLHFNFSQSDRHEFVSAIYELFVNVYEHSDSWGLAMIHARPDRGTFICCHDIGVGIRRSLADSPNVSEKIENDYQAIRWALVEGHSRKVGGSGSGLTIIEEFVSERNGNIEIRSGECLLQRTSGSIDWKPYRVSWFPGTQLNLYVPITPDRR